MTENILQFLKNISKKHNIPFEELSLDWKEYTSPKKKTCIYEFVKSPKKGQLCGTKIKGDGSYCSKHKKFEKESSPILSPKPENDKKIPIRINKNIGRYVHTETGMVFFSKDERVVFGKLVKDTIQQLSQEDIEVCKSFGFKIDKTKFQQIFSPKKKTTKKSSKAEDD